MWKSILMAAVVVIAASPRLARGQRDEPPRIPRAISGAELNRYGDILGLSDGQRHAIEGEFERYLDEFEPLRAEMIECAVRYPRHGRIDDDIAPHIAPFMARVRGMDDAWFAGIEALLTETQRAGLPRIHALRERTLLTSIDSVARFIGDGVPEMRELLEALDPPAETLQPLAPALDAYEARLTGAVRGVYESALKACSAEGDVARDQLIDRVRAARALNREFFDATAPSLPEDLRRRWRTEFILHAYGSVPEISNAWVLHRINAALASDLTEAQRQAALQLQREAEQAEAEAAERLMELLDREAIALAPPQGARRSQEYLDVVNGMRQDLGRRGAQWHQALESLVGKDRLQSLDTPVADGRRSQMAWRQACGVVSFAGRVQPPSIGPRVSGWRIEATTPQPISGELFSTMLECLGIEGDAREPVVAAHDAYAAKMEAELMPMREEAFRYSAHVGPAAQTPADPLARANAGAALRAKMRAAIDAADAALLEQVLAMLGRDADAEGRWERTRRMYERSRVTLDVSWMTTSEPNRAAEIDLVQALAQQHPDAAAWKSCDTVLLDYEARLMTQRTAAFDMLVQFNRDELARRDGLRDEGPDGGHRRWQERNEGLHERYQALAALNHDSVTLLVAALPSAIAAGLADEYRRYAFPKAYADDAYMAPALQRAADLTDATAEQRSRIAELRSVFMTAYEDNRRAIIEQCAALPPEMPQIGMTMTPDRTERHERFVQEFQRLSDQRSEINRHALRGLRTALSPPQLRRLQLPEIN